MIKTISSWIEINQSAFTHNLTAYQQLLSADKLLTVVVKGNAYGHGLAQIVQLCHKHPAVYGICTVSLSEAIVARQHMPTKFILVLSTLDTAPEALIEYDIDIVVYDLVTLQKFNILAQRHNTRINIHLKIDTGMGRFGFLPDEAPTLVKKIQAMSGIKLRGICTHFAESNDADQTFTLQQQKIFDDALDNIQPLPPLVHSANSGGALFTSNHCNLVRLGSGAYGFWPSTAYKKVMRETNSHFDLRSIMTWKTRIMHIKTVPAGQPIGYDRTYVTQQPTKLAVLPIGYCDGYDRRLSNCGQVLVNKKYAPVIGRVCMNVTLIDITNIPDARVGDTVILLGDYPHIRAHDIAAYISSAHREVVTRINPLIARMILD